MFVDCEEPKRFVETSRGGIVRSGGYRHCWVIHEGGYERAAVPASEVFGVHGESVDLATVGGRGPSNDAHELPAVPTAEPLEVEAPKIADIFVHRRDSVEADEVGFDSIRAPLNLDDARSHIVV